MYLNKKLLYVAMMMLALFSVVSAGEESWISLFDGKSLKGWEHIGGKHDFRVRDGVVVGTSVEKEPSAFLVSENEYLNFELIFEVKIGSLLNSGCQIRSQLINNNKAMKGPQVEIHAENTGFIYGMHMKKPGSEERAGWLWQGKKSKILNYDTWNTIRIVVVNNHYRTWVNGTSVADLTIEHEDANKPGHIGLQIHSSKGDQIGKEVAWRNIKIRPIY